MPECGALAGLALFSCLASDPACLPERHARHLPLLVGIARQESGFHPYAVRVEAGRGLPARSFYPEMHDEAVKVAVEYDRQGRTLGLGLFQITHRENWDRHFGVARTPQERADQIARALLPCPSMAAGAAHFAADWDRAGVALNYYNSGRPDGAPGYAADVLRRVRASSPAPLGAAAPFDPVSPRIAPPSRVAADLLHDDDSAPADEAADAGVARTEQPQERQDP